MHSPTEAGGPTSVATARARHVPLAVGLTAIVLLLAAGLAAVLLGWLQPRAARAFETVGAELVRDGSAAMHELALEHSTLTGDILMDVLRASSNDRERSLRELRLQDLAGDAEAVRAAIAADDARRAAHERQNVLALTAASLRRVEDSIAARLDALTRAQSSRTVELVGELRELHLGLVGATLALALAGLGFGLRRLVLQPVRQLRAATQRVAAGDLDAAPGAPPQNELGLLAQDFAAMTDQLRAARGAQERFAAELAREVADKTAHLERALRELRESHHQLAQAERLAALGTLAGGVAHEFHNVIGGIRGCAADLAGDEPDADRRETLAVITRAADRGTAIVQQLLRFARRSVERTAEVDANALVDDALRLCEPAARRQQCRVVRETTPGLLLRGDADGLHQVLVNLLVNALQAMPGGGTLRVSTARDGDRVLVTVADTGHGIAAADLPHIFEPFFTTKRGVGDQPVGSGLGLSVSWGIVAAHGGRIEVASPPGRGTTFTVRLPVGR
jgi:signal transduction histidine kinase